MSLISVSIRQQQTIHFRQTNVFGYAYTLRQTSVFAYVYILRQTNGVDDSNVWLLCDAKPQGRRRLGVARQLSAYGTIGSIGAYIPNPTPTTHPHT